MNEYMRIRIRGMRENKAKRNNNNIKVYQLIRLHPF